MTSHLNIASETASSVVPLDSSPRTFSVAPDAPNLAFHPLANIFPLLDDQAHDKLVADVREHSVREPIWLLDGQILDGRNRWRAAKAANVECRAREYKGADAASFVVSLNLHRRHLNTSQRALVATRLASLKLGANQHVGSPTPTQTQAAEMLNVSRDSVIQARKVVECGVPKLLAAVERGQVTVNAAAKVAELPQNVQAGLVAAGAKEIRKTAATLGSTHHVSKNSGNNEWYTPPWVIELARSSMGDIDTDPASCATANLIVGATTYFTAKQDGLKQKWSGRVWLNPPYSQGLVGHFVEALATKFGSDEIDQACVLVNNATETEWFHRLMDVASAVCFPRGRIKFQNESGLKRNSPLQGQAILYLGRDAELFTAAFESIGRVLAIV
jgi:ParB family chromosome partitioning protein